MKLRVHPWRLIWRFLLVLLLIYVMIFLVSYSFFFQIDLENKQILLVPWDFRQPLLIVGIFVLGLGAFIPSLTNYYYVIESKYFVMRKYGKEYQFEYSNIEFIDIEASKKKNMVIFYSSKAKMRYLLGDKDGKLLETLIKKCPNNMTVEDFRRAHPEEKY